MFLDINTFKKKSLTFNVDDDYFTVDGVRKKFIATEQFFCRTTEHYTNRVYQGDSLEVELQFAGAPQREVYAVDSNHQQNYLLLLRIAKAATSFRRKRLALCYAETQEVHFALRGQAQPLRLVNTQLLFGDIPVRELVIAENKGHYPLLEFVLSAHTLVVEPYSNDRYVEINGPRPAEEIQLKERRLIIDLADISDSDFFMELVRKLPVVTLKPATENRSALKKLLVMAVVLFGINGWLAVYSDYALFMDNRLVELASVVARLLFASWIILWPFFRLVDRLNMKKIARIRSRFTENNLL